MATAGYSGTPLFKKLGIKEDSNIAVINGPSNYFLLLNLPVNYNLFINQSGRKDLIHFFTKSSDDLHKHLPGLKEQIFKNGSIWISWPKKASKVITDLNEDVIRDVAINSGLVDVKVCAIDEVWSALKLVISVADRSQL